MLWALIALAVVGTIVGVGSSHYQAAKNEELQEDAQAFSAEQQEDAQEFNAAQAEEAYDRQVEFYENYQSPKAMVNQYREAGLNPALMFGGSVGGSSTPQTAASSSPVGAGMGSVSPISALQPISELMSTLSMMKVNESIANKNNAEADESGARKLNYQELAGLTAQQRLTEVERTNEVKANAAAISHDDLRRAQKWIKESVQMDEELKLTQSRKDLTDAEKDFKLAEKLAMMANADYRRWYADTATLRYIVDCTFKVLGAGIEIARVANVWRLTKSKLLKNPPRVGAGDNVDDQGYGGYHRTDWEEYVDEIDKIFNEIDKLPPSQQPLSLPPQD